MMLDVKSITLGSQGDDRGDEDDEDSESTRIGRSRNERNMFKNVLRKALFSIIAAAGG